MAMPSCPGWGLQKWSDDPWGGSDTGSPVIASIHPECGSIDISATTPITIKVCNNGCSGLGVECIRIYVNSNLIYDGTGLTLGTLNNGFAAPCNENCSAAVSATDANGNFCITFTICCTPFSCNSTVNISATFCSPSGATISIADCSFNTWKCNAISKVEIIDSRHLAVRFVNRLLPNPNLNKDLYLPTSWFVSPVSGAFLTGNSVEVKNVLVEKSFLPKTIILETDRLTSGAMYEVTGSPAVLDMYRQPLVNEGKSVLVGRKTKLDSMLARLPQMYKVKLNNGIEDTNKLVSLWQILAPLAIEDERKGGDY